VLKVCTWSRLQYRPTVKRVCREAYAGRYTYKGKKGSIYRVYLRVETSLYTSGCVYLRVYSLPGWYIPGYTSECIASLGGIYQVYTSECIASLGVYTRVYTSGCVTGMPPYYLCVTGMPPYYPCVTVCTTMRRVLLLLRVYNDAQSAPLP